MRGGGVASKARVMEDKRDVLNTEPMSLSLQADTRARLDLKRSEVKSRALEVKRLSRESWPLELGC